MNEYLEEINRLVQRLQDGFNELVGAINDVLSWVPWGLGWAADKVRDAFGYLEEKWNQFWDATTLIFGNMGDLGAVEAVGQQWSSDLGSPVSQEVGNVDRALLRADDHWKGQAAEAYFPKAQLHKTAMEKLQGFTDTAADALDGVRAGLVKFYAGLVVALGALVGGLVAALASSATIFGIPAGIFIFAAACLAAEGSFFAGGLLLKSDCNSAQSKLNRKLGELTGFPDGAWPPGAVLTA